MELKIEEYCNPIYEEMKKLRVDFKKETLKDKKLLKHFKEDNPRDRFSSILVTGTILGGIQLRNLWRENELQNVLDELEWYVQMNTFEDE